MKELASFHTEKEYYLPLKAVVIGAGNVSPQYLRYLQHSENIRVSAIADCKSEAAIQRADDYGILEMSETEVFSTAEYDMVINLTNPQSHAAVTEKALKAGKHVYSEKPLATTFLEGKRLVALAEETGKQLGCAPDTFLTPDIQEARRRIDKGEIGEIVEVFGKFSGNGPEQWHPNPASFYAAGGGPVFDMGPYYLTTLAFLLGPVTEVEATGSIERRNRPFPVEVPTTVSSYLQYGDVPAEISFSFDGICDPLGLHLEIIGTKGNIGISDPNSYDQNSFYLHRYPHGPQALHRYARGMGTEEFGSAIQRGKRSRMHAQLGLHVLEVMELIHNSVESGRTRYPTTSVNRPEPLFSAV
jgi:predicted dehydrogenase